MADKKQQAEQMMTMAQMQQMMRERDALKQMNCVRIACQVMEVMEFEPKQKMDKNKQPIFKDNGEPDMMEKGFWVSGATMGSEEGFFLNEKQAQNIEVGQTYLFSGRLKNRKVKIDTIELI